MTYGPKFPLKDSCWIHGISSRFSLQDTQVDIRKYLNATTVVLLLPERPLAGNKQLSGIVKMILSSASR